MKFKPEEPEFSFTDLRKFVSENKPTFIEMTERDEFWYRSLLTPDLMTDSVVTFNGIPIVISQ